MTNDEKTKKFLKHQGEKTICVLIGHDERVFPTDDDEGNVKYEIRCKRCNDFIKDIKSFYED
jgi:hypothetical protein